MSVFLSLTSRRVCYRNLGVACALALLSGCARSGKDEAAEVSTMRIFIVGLLCSYQRVVYARVDCIDKSTNMIMLLSLRG